MALAKQAAMQIVAAVRSDPECLRRIKSVIPDLGGYAGSVRNLGYIFTFQDPTDPETAAKVCTGIAEQTMTAINNALGPIDHAGRPEKGSAIPDVESANTIDRVHLSTHHTATLVSMKDGTEYVFDWHATLNVENPLIYESPERWQVDKGSVQFKHFSGFLT
jgi:hypothetical protein